MKHIINKLFIIFFGITFLTLGACATNGGYEVEAGSSAYIMHAKTGIITEIKPVVIKDSGAGTFIGALTGAVLGSTMGGGRGNTLTTLGGGLAGAYAGDEIGKANAQQLMVKLDNGNSVVVIAKGKSFAVGEEVKIITNGGRVVTVEHK